MKKFMSFAVSATHLTTHLATFAKVIGVAGCALFVFTSPVYAHSGGGLERPQEADYRTTSEYLDAVLEYNRSKKIEILQKRKQARDAVLNPQEPLQENVLAEAKPSNDVGLVINFPLARLKREDERSVLVDWAKQKKKCVHVLKQGDSYSIIRQGSSEKYGTSTSCNPPHLSVAEYLEDDDVSLEKALDRFKEDDPLADLALVDDIATADNFDVDTALEVLNLTSIGEDGKSIQATFVFEEQRSRTRLEDFVDNPEARDNLINGLASGDIEGAFSNDAGANANLEIVFSGVVDVTLIFEDD